MQKKNTFYKIISSIIFSIIAMILIIWGIIFIDQMPIQLFIAYIIIPIIIWFIYVPLLNIQLNQNNRMLLPLFRICIIFLFGVSNLLILLNSYPDSVYTIFWIIFLYIIIVISFFTNFYIGLKLKKEITPNFPFIIPIIVDVTVWIIIIDFFRNLSLFDYFTIIYPIVIVLPLIWITFTQYAIDIRTDELPTMFKRCIRLLKIFYPYQRVYYKKKQSKN